MIRHPILKIKQNSFVLLPDKAIYWQEENALLIADVHLGKTASFRSKGFAVPGGTTTNDLQRISNLIEDTHAKKIFFLGDLFHAKSGQVKKTLHVFSEWRNKYTNVDIILIRGNHDKNSGDPPAELKIEAINSPGTIKNISLSHNPMSIDNMFVFSGHIHPAVRLYGKGKLREKVPCFIFKKEYAVLPAFGGFTGTYVVLPDENDRVFIPTEDEVIEVDKKYYQKNMK